jgi:hypothetical protein
VTQPGHKRLTCRDGHGDFVTNGWTAVRAQYLAWLPPNSLNKDVTTDETPISWLTTFGMVVPVDLHVQHAAVPVLLLGDYWDVFRAGGPSVPIVRVWLGEVVIGIIAPFRSREASVSVLQTVADASFGRLDRLADWAGVTRTG